MNPPTSRLPALIAALVALAVAGYFGWQQFKPAPAPVAPAAAPSAAAPEVLPEPVAPEPTPPAIQHPVEAPVAGTTAEPTPLPALDGSDEHVSGLLAGLLSRKNLLTFLQLDGFVRRAVATVDNLARSQAPVMGWPVIPTPQRFTTQRGENGVETIHPGNSQRYVPLVLMIESVDTGKAVDLYRSLYPLF
ncbi:MAG: DUF3014 domain-containing protein, partial [Variovorax sp.]|nr:DUF3014 domain-containing protein [Variovorax sp.]